MAASIPCARCERPFDPIAGHWRCPACGYRDTCCQGEALPVAEP